MTQMILQVLLTIVSWLGIAISWVSGYRGKRRIKQPLAGILTNLGVLVMFVPWIIMPILEQPRLVGPLQTVTFAMGILFLVAAVAIEIRATPFIFPAAKKGGDELDPEFLVVEGPYQRVRHPQYLGAVLLFIGWILLLGGLYSLLLCPIVYLLLRFEAYLEESRVLEPKFGGEFRQFKEQVSIVILGRIGTIILIVTYLIFVSLLVLGYVAWV